MTRTSLRTRRNPHREKLYVDGPRERKRLSSTVSPYAPPAVHDVRRIPRRVSGADGCVLVVPDLANGELSDHDRDVLGAARAFVDASQKAIIVLTFTPDADINWSEHGADRIIQFPRKTDYAPEWDAAVIEQTRAKLRPDCVLAPDVTPGIGDTLRRLATTQNLSIATNARSLSFDRVVSSLAESAFEAHTALTDIVLLTPECAEPPINEVSAAEAVHLDLDETLPSPRITSLGEEAIARTDLSLNDAEFVIAAGNGVTDWDAFHTLAKTLNATEGGSRVICDAGIMPKARQIGASGVLIDARCYFALGIAGAPQHLQGVAKCKHVIAVNTDLHADMIKRADLAIVADAQEVMPRLTEHANAMASDVKTDQAS